MNQLLSNYIEKRISQPTVILCFRILLDNMLKNGIDSGMTKSEVSKIFNEHNRKFGITRFRTDYMLRQSGNSSENAIYENNKRFYIYPEFLEGLSIDELKKVSKEINDRFYKISEVHKQLYNEIESATKLTIGEKVEFIIYMLLDKETDKKGQSFEVTAFAILKAFYSIRGFELNRFSTIYSNDGGIDYTSQTSIYQVTTHLNDTKFDEDLAKAPLKKRILVFKKSSKDFDFESMKHELVSDYIDATDLINHLNYLAQKNPDKNIDMILSVILDEFKREYYY